MSTETPRTDAHEVMMHGIHMVPAAHARNLERELTAAKQRIAELEAELGNIATANPRAWGDQSSEFEPWVKNRARFMLNKATALKAAPTPLDRPDGPGWWWEMEGEWKMREVVIVKGGPAVWNKAGFWTMADSGKWLRANPPDEPVREGGE